MEAIRTVQRAKSQELVVEVIVLPIEQKQTKKNSFDPDSYRGIWKNIDINVEQTCREMRKE